LFILGAKYQRIDVFFGRYQDESIKAGTMTKRKQRHRSVRRKIENDASVPSNWSGLMTFKGNKADLALLLSNHLIEHSPTDQII